MKKGTPVSAIMTKHVITLKTTDNLETAESLFKKYHIRHIPVCSGSKLIGMLSYTDLLRISFADAVYEDEETVDSMVYNMFSIEQVMAKNLVSVSSNTMVKDVAELLSKREFHAIPVVDDGKLVGIITTTDLINFLLQQYED
ncbi:CBS domain-containing protein [Maribacter arenosus]|uniref:CBS domain-containing protein n=1 Tax=Maribacter arenosus TaxID=1854708 RepID=A0ABR7V8I6_9FLAO|nr:CBS domain-containing protein [Maribacter arenosus]MBD0849984.1 CBS domain-containing protein [Maribacter arenosus]